MRQKTSIFIGMILFTLVFGGIVSNSVLASEGERIESAEMLAIVPGSFTLKKSSNPTGPIWTDVLGNLTVGYSTVLNPLNDYEYIQVSSLLASPVLADGWYGIDFDAFRAPDDFWTYWAGEGIDENSTGDDAVMWQIINGDLPMFYIKAEGGAYSLVDGYLHAIDADPSSVVTPWRLNGDFPLGTYHFGGWVSDAEGGEEYLNIQITFTKQATVSITPQTSTIGDSGYVDVFIHLADVHDLYSVDINLEFDHTMLEVVDMDDVLAGDNLQSVNTWFNSEYLVYNEADNTTGIIRYAATQLRETAPANGSGNIAMIRFRTKQVGTGDITVTSALLSDRDGFLLGREVILGSGTITVKDVPVAVADDYEMPMDSTLIVDAPGVLGNDTGSTGATLTADLVTDVDFGALTLDEDGSFSYTPPTAGWTGTATFDYRACDGSVCSEAVSVTIEVKVRPTAEADAYQTPKNVTLNVDAINGVLNNDTGADGATLTAKLVTDVTVGTLTLNTDGSFEYIPQTDMLGSVPFTYQACDGEVCSEPVTVTIEVKVKPTAAADAYQTAKNATLNISAGAGVLSNDTGTGLHAELVTDVTVGTLTLNPDGSFEYIPATDMLGPVTFTYQACDGLVCSDSATVTITVKDTPVANDDSYWTFVDEALTVPASGVLENDTAPNSEPLHAVLVDDVPASAGTLAFESDGSFVFTPESGFVGMTTFTYRACYNGICSAPATVTIKVLETTCLVVDPESLEQSLYPNKTANQTLTITNTCDYEVPFELLETTAPLTTPLLLDEGFEGGLSFPIDWLRFSRGATLNTWTIKDALVDNPAHIDEGQYAAWITYDVANASDEWLLTLPMDVSAAEDLTLAFRAWSSTLYPGATMKVWVTDETGDPLTDEPLWDLIRDEDWADPGYRSVFVDLSAFDGYDTGEIRIAWQYVGQNGQSFGLDEVQVGARTEVPWLSQNPTSAVLPASGSTNITVTFDSTGMVEGDFFAAIFVQSEPYPTVQVPVILHVLGEGLEYYFPLFRR